MNINTETPLTDQLGKLGMPIGTFVKLEDCQRIEKAFHQKCQEVRDLKARIEALEKGANKQTAETDEPASPVCCHCLKYECDCSDLDVNVEGGAK